MTIIEDMLAINAEAGSSHWDHRRGKIGNEIEKAALRLFLTMGPDTVSVDMIADAAGISRRTFFRYFRTRDDILIAQPARHLLNSSKAFCLRPAEEGLIEALINTTREHLHDKDEIVHLSYQVMSRYPEIWNNTIGNLYLLMGQAYEQMIRHRLTMRNEDPKQAGIIAAGLAPLVIHSYKNWVNTARRNSFASALEQELKTFFAIQRIAPLPIVNERFEENHA